MSFSEEIKEELLQIEVRTKEECLAELEGMYLLLSKYIYQQEDNIYWEIENYYSLRRVATLLEIFLNRKIQPLEKISKKKVYQLSLSHEELEKLKNEMTSYCAITKKGGLLAGFLRGCFMVAGSITHPEKNYHFEIVCDTIEQADYIRRHMEMISLRGKSLKRKLAYIVYLKEANQIGDFLAAIGAHQGLLQMENIRILKDISNSINRQVNCDAANIKKTVNASIRQIEKIEYVVSKIGIMGLPPKLREVARLRLEYQNETLSELGERMVPPVSKSGVYHRLKKIEEISSVV